MSRIATSSAHSASIDGAVAKDILERCACARMRRISRQLTRRYDEALRPVGLRSTQLILLMEIARADRLSFAELSQSLSIDASTLTRNLAPLERDGLVRSEKSPGGRRRSTRLTEKGTALIERSIPLWRQAQERFERIVGKRDWRRLQQKLSSIEI